MQPERSRWVLCGGQEGRDVGQQPGCRRPEAMLRLEPATPAESTVQGAVGPLWIWGPLGATEHTAPMTVHQVMPQPRCGLRAEGATCR